MSAELVIAIATVAATPVSVVAAVAAGRSAADSEKSEAGSAALRRKAIRELVGLHHDVMAEDLRIIDLGATLDSEYTALFVLSGASGCTPRLTTISIK